MKERTHIVLMRLLDIRGYYQHHDNDTVSIEICNILNKKVLDILKKEVLMTE